MTHFTSTTHRDAVDVLEARNKNKEAHQKALTSANPKLAGRFRVAYMMAKELHVRVCHCLVEIWVGYRLSEACGYVVQA